VRNKTLSPDVCYKYSNKQFSDNYRYYRGGFKTSLSAGPPKAGFGPGGIFLL